MFEIKNVTKKYNGEFALNNVSLNIGKGLNFIVGASGSGKTTLLKIISGLEPNFDGEVTYCNKNIKTLTQDEKSYFYNNTFGFVWQDFNLLQDSTVLDNILLPRYLKGDNNQKNAEKILNDLKIFDIASQKVKYLSGGQKQRVAIARELMKNPQVIIADEPTSALDENTSRTTMDILRSISKTRTVIIVTHNTALITDKDNVFELDKGELISSCDIVYKKSDINMQNVHTLPFTNTIRIAKSNICNKYGRFLVSTFTLVIASVLLLTTVNGTIAKSSQGEFDKLIETYGESLTDIGLYNSFTNAAATDGKDESKPSGNVNQDISGLYELYAKDERVSFVNYQQAFNNINITVDGKNYPVKSSGNAPAINKLVAGNMPMGDGNEVVIPESFVKLLGVKSDAAIGKTIDFKGAIYDWSSGEPVLKDTNVKAKIVGVVDTTTKYDYNGQITEYTIYDAFLFSKSALDKITEQAGTNINKMNFLLRAKTPRDMIAIKDELNEKGIVPIGRFELVEDMVRLNNQTTQQSGSASIVISILSLVMVAFIFLITAIMRKREYAIYKVSGYNNRHLNFINFTETLSLIISAALLMLVTSPLLNIATNTLFKVNILNVKSLSIGILLIILTSLIAYLVTAIIYTKTNTTLALKSGDK